MPRGLQRISLLKIASKPASSIDEIAVYVKYVLSHGALIHLSEKLVLLLTQNLEKNIFTNLVSNLGEKGLVVKGVSVLDREPYIGYLRGIKYLEKSPEIMYFEEGIEGSYCIGKAFPRSEDLFEKFYPEIINAFAEVCNVIKTINGLPMLVGSYIVFLIPCRARSVLEQYRGLFDYVIHEDKDPVKLLELLGLRNYWSVLML